MFKYIQQAVSSLFFPQRCRGCNRQGSAICSKCLAKIPLATTLPARTFAVYEYGHKLVKSSIRDLKYSRHSEATKILAQNSIPYISEYLSSDIQSSNMEKFIIIPIPEHSKKMTSKGFNQSQMIAKWFASGLNGEVKNLLKKTIFTLPQARLSRSQRLKNVIKTMESKVSIDPAYIYLIVDDVTTTGATFTEAKRALSASGAKKIFCIALSHGYK